MTMKELFTKASTTSIVAVLTVLIGFGLLFFIVGTGKPTDDTSRVQVITGVLAIMGLPLSYFFGAAKNRSTQATTNTGDVNLTPENEAK